MAITVVHTTTASSLTVTIPATTAGNCLVVCVGSYSSSFPVPSVTGVTLGGSAGNFSQLASVSNTPDLSAVWADPNCAGGQTSVVISGSNLNVGSAAGGVVIYEISGVATSSVLDKSSTGNGTSTAYSSGATATTTQANEIWIGTANGFNTLSPPASPWTSTQPTGDFAVAGYQVVSSAGSATYSGTVSSSGKWTAVVVTLKGAASNVSVSLTTAQVTAAGAAPGTGAGPVALTVAQEITAAPAPAAKVIIPLAVAQVNIAAARVTLPVFLTPAAVTAAAVPVTPTVGIVLSLPAAAVRVTALAPGISGPGVVLQVAAVTIAAHMPGLPRFTAIPAAAVTIAAHPPAPSVNVFVALTAARSTIAAHPPVPSRQLLICLAAKAGTDDYGTGFPQGILATAGVISGPVFEGTDFVIDSAGAFFYSGTPGSGNLIASITRFSGTDAHGNAYQAGFAAYDNSNGTWCQLSSGAVNFSNGGTLTNAVSGLLELNNNMTTAVVLNNSTDEIDLDANAVLVGGNNLTALFGNLDPSGYPLSGSATLSAVISTLNSTISRLQAIGIFS